MQQQTSFGNCSATETSSNSNSSVNTSLNNSSKSLIQYDINGSSDSSPSQSATKYDELQSNKLEHELSNGNELTSNTANYPLQHIRFPDVPYSSELVNEFMIFLYTMIATAMQFLHLYRTVWWLPESNTNQAMV